MCIRDRPKYEASAKLFVGKEATTENYNNSDITMYQQLVKTYTSLIKTEDLVSKALKDNNIDLDPKIVAVSYTHLDGKTSL